MIIAAMTIEPGASAHEIKAALAGNLCRCTGYLSIFRSVEAVVTPPRRKGARARGR